MTIGTSSVRLNRVSNTPKTRVMVAKFMSRVVHQWSEMLAADAVAAIMPAVSEEAISGMLEKGEANLEQFLDVASVLFIQQEHNDVIARLHHHIIIGNDHLTVAVGGVADQRADGGPFR